MTLHAAVAEVLGMGVALRAVAENGDRLALQGFEVGVFVVVNRSGHGGDSCSLGIQLCVMWMVRR